MSETPTELKMPYKLTLTMEEREAINWIGDRYGHGDSLYKLLLRCESNDESNDDWNQDEITYQIPENVAWQINEIGEESNFLWDCFADDLAQKMSEFCMAIV